MDKVWLSTRYYADEKFDGISANAERMFSRLLALAGQLENGGRLPAKPWTYVGMPKAQKSTEELVQRGILIKFPDGTYDFPAWAGWQDSGDKLASRKRSDRERKRLQRERERAAAETASTSRQGSGSGPASGPGADHSEAQSGPVQGPTLARSRESRNRTESDSEQGNYDSGGEHVSRDTSRDVTPPEERRGEEIRDIRDVDTTSYVTPATRNGRDEPPINATSGALALVADLPDRLPNGRRIPKQTRHQMLQALNATSRSAAAHEITRQFTRSLDGTLDRHTTTDIAHIVDELLADHIPPAQIAAGLTAWQQSDSWSPTQIRRFVAKAATTQTPSRTTGKPTTAATAANTAANELIKELGL